MTIHVLWSYWWLLFPAAFFVTRVVHIVLRNNYRREKLAIIKSYVDQGKEVPDVLARELYR